MAPWLKRFTFLVRALYEDYILEPILGETLFGTSETANGTLSDMLPFVIEGLI